MKPNILHEIIQTLFPSDVKCIACGKEIAPNRYGLCEQCGLEINDNYCARCGRHKVGVGEYCDECADMSLFFDEARSAVNFDGRAKALVHRFKYGSAQYLAEYFAEFMLDVLFRSNWDFDAFTYVPMHKKRQKERGYNQAQLLAKALSGRTDAPCSDLLVKSVETPNQAKSNRSERMANLKGSFSCSVKPPEHVVLIDDVMTTGSTANECSRVLKKAGAKVVYVLTFASVPERPELEIPLQNISNFRRK